MSFERLVLPGGYRSVVALTFDNFGESYDLLKYGHAGGVNADGVYAPRRGVERILDLLDRYHIQGTFFLEGWNVRKYATLAREVADRGHEVAAHGWMHEHWNTLSFLQETDLIRLTTETIEEAVGSPPRGWRSPGGLTTVNTLHLLMEAGYAYDSSFGDEDVPYLLQVKRDIDRKIIELPWRWTLDDAMYYSPSHSIRRASEVAQLWIEEFDAVQSLTGYFMLVCHPRFSGRPAQVLALEHLIKHIASCNGVKFARCDEIAEIAGKWTTVPSHSAPEIYSEEHHP